MSTKRSTKLYAIWDYEIEIEDLNRESENGWQLIQGKCFGNKFEKDNSVIYRYQLDYNNAIGNENEYFNMFKEQGWEYINSTFNGWHYFKKVYDPTQQESEYQIYTDISSKKGMVSKFVRLMLLVTTAVLLSNFALLYSFIESPKIASSGVVFLFLCILYLPIKTLVGAKKMVQEKIPKRRTKIGAYFVVLCLLMLLSIAGNSGQVIVHMDNSYMVTEDTRVNSFIYMTEMSDFYYVDLKTMDKFETKIVISDTEGNIKYEKSGINLVENHKRIFLQKGEYICTITCIGDIKTDCNGLCQYSVSIE